MNEVEKFANELNLAAVENKASVDRFFHKDMLETYKATIFPKLYYNEYFISHELFSLKSKSHEFVFKVCCFVNCDNGGNGGKNANCLDGFSTFELAEKNIEFLMIKNIIE